MIPSRYACNPDPTFALGLNDGGHRVREAGLTDRGEIGAMPGLAGFRLEPPAPPASGIRLSFLSEKGAGFGDGNHLREPRPACLPSPALPGPSPGAFSEDYLQGSASSPRTVLDHLSRPRRSTTGRCAFCTALRVRERSGTALNMSPLRIWSRCSTPGSAWSRPNHALWRRRACPASPSHWDKCGTDTGTWSAWSWPKRF